MNKGRMREFYQCDIDIAGQYDPMVPDAEVIRIICEVFESLGWNGNYTIKMNHRKILDGIFKVCGVTEDNIRPISSAVDKLDKLPWEEVKKEMTQEKGLSEEVADKIGQWALLKGKRDLLDKLRADEGLSANEDIKKGISDLDLLFDYLEAFECLDRVSFDLSLARYTPPGLFRFPSGGTKFMYGQIANPIFPAEVSTTTPASSTRSSQKARLLLRRPGRRLPSPRRRTNLRTTTIVPTTPASVLAVWRQAVATTISWACSRARLRCLALVSLLVWSASSGG